MELGQLGLNYGTPPDKKDIAAWSNNNFKERRVPSWYMMLIKEVHLTAAVITGSIPSEKSQMKLLQ